MFGVTRKEAGWDCMRHTEVMASGCVPYFVDLEKLPKATLHFYPKDLFRRAKTLEGVTRNWPFLDPNFFSVDTSKLNFEEYYDIATQILEHSGAKGLGVLPLFPNFRQFFPLSQKSLKFRPFRHILP